MSDHDNKDRIARLVRWRSTTTVKDSEAARVALEEYVRRMPEGQPAIYYLTAPQPRGRAREPAARGVPGKGYEVLLLVDNVDEWVIGHLHEFDKRPLRSVAKGATDLASAEDKKALEEQQKAHGGFIAFVKEAAGENIGEVRLSDRLTDSPCCLVGEEHAMSPQMEELMRRMGQEVPRQKRTLELNPTQPLVQGLRAAQEGGKGDPERLKGQVRLLRDQALLAEGGRLQDPAAFAKGVQELMLGALGAASASRMSRPWLTDWIDGLMGPRVLSAASLQELEQSGFTIFPGLALGTRLANAEEAAVADAAASTVSVAGETTCYSGQLDSEGGITRRWRALRCWVIESPHRTRVTRAD